MDVHLFRFNRESSAVLIDLKELIEPLIDLKGAAFALSDDGELMGRVTPESEGPVYQSRGLP